MAQLSAPVLAWIRAGYPEGVPDAEAAALTPCSRSASAATRPWTSSAGCTGEGRSPTQAAGALLPDDEQMRRVAAKLVLGGWPLAQ